MTALAHMCNPALFYLVTSVGVEVNIFILNDRLSKETKTLFLIGFAPKVDCFILSDIQIKVWRRRSTDVS